MGNNDYGNCVIVTAAHMILCWQATAAGDTRRITDTAVVELSTEMRALHGYNILDRLRYWRKNQMWANPLWAFASIDTNDPATIKATVNAFGAIDIGVNMPTAWKNKNFWDTGTGRLYRPNSWGGHSVPIVGYDENTATIVTWGELVKITWAALADYCDERYALINPSWLQNQGITPSQFNLAQLHADLYAATGQQPFYNPAQIMDHPNNDQHPVTLPPIMHMRMLAKEEAEKIIMQHLDLCPFASLEIEKRLRDLERNFTGLIGWMIGSGLAGGVAGTFIQRLLP